MPGVDLLGEFLGELKISENRTWMVMSTLADGKTRLISTNNSIGIIPIGTFLTIEEENKKFILRVDKSVQEEKYKLSDLLAESNIEIPNYEKNSINVVIGNRVGETNLQDNGSYSFIKPGSHARLSTQEEIETTLEIPDSGAPVFLATNLFGKATVLRGLDNKSVYSRIPDDVFYHQTIIAGKTGSGKTNSLKYLAQYFVEELHGAVIAVNVKGRDLLTMNRPSKFDENNKNEFSQIKSNFSIPSEITTIEHGIENCLIYVPYKKDSVLPKGVDPGIVKYITLNVDSIDPQSLIGLMRNLTEIAASVLPDVFRYWSMEVRKDNEKFSDFVKHFIDGTRDNPIIITGRTVSGEVVDHHLPRSTVTNILRELTIVSKYFDAPSNKAITLKPEDFVQKEMLSVIDLAKDIEFGSILLMDIIRKIKDYAYSYSLDTPILFIIDETHLFYNSNSAKEALEDLSTICRTGRQYKVAIIFASQDPGDIPNELTSVVATKMFFQSERKEASSFGLDIGDIDIETLQKGFCAVKIKDQPYLKLVKFPKAMAGVDNERN